MDYGQPVSGWCGLMSQPAIFDDLSALADSTRGRMVRLLEGQELTVSELCDVLQLPQSTVSRHLKVLADAGWVSWRRDGTSRYYTAALGDEGSARQALWRAVRDPIGATLRAAEDRRRLEAVLERRREKSQAFFAAAANDWDRLREELFGRHFCVRAMFGFFDPEWVIGDLGCGTGQVAAGLAPYVGRVIAVDASGEMLQAARRRLEPFHNVSIRRGRLEALPIEEGELDGAALVLVLHHLPEPRVVLREAARVLKPRGRIVVVDMLPHDREAYRQEMGHIWLGFSEARIIDELVGAGFERVRVRALPPECDAKGPALFVAMADRAPVAAELAAAGERSRETV
jgi:ubiquinone/menaquinone biosynthesis C-methylase UbiE/DNA-binding transcriptional ArsR family regulator